MDGFSATNIIRTIEQTLVQAGEHIIPLAIVAVTGKSIESKPQCLAVGMQVLITHIGFYSHRVFFYILF